MAQGVNMQFKVNINMDNDAYSSMPEIELTRNLAVIINELVAGKTYGPVMDDNGNKVGKWEIIDLQGR